MLFGVIRRGGPPRDAAKGPWQNGTGTSQLAVFEIAKCTRLGASPILPRAAMAVHGHLWRQRTAVSLPRPSRSWAATMAAARCLFPAMDSVQAGASHGISARSPGPHIKRRDEKATGLQPRCRLKAGRACDALARAAPRLSVSRLGGRLRGHRRRLRQRLSRHRRRLVWSRRGRRGRGNPRCSQFALGTEALLE
jgi:hypothetical protein